MFSISIEQQFRLLLYLCIFGLIIGLFFDLFKAWGKAFRFSRRAFFLVDLGFCLFLALTLFYLLLYTNQGEVRLYTFIALLVGILLYYSFGSPHLYQKFLVFFQTLKTWGKKIIKTILLWQELVNKKRNIHKDS